MNANAYFDELRLLARQVRHQHGLTTSRVMLSDMRRIYKSEGVKIVYTPSRMKGIRGAYFNDETGPWVLVERSLPDEPKIFTLGHELKHHLKDRNVQTNSSMGDPIEVGAEVFAAELIYPHALFCHEIASMGVSKGMCTPERVIALKRSTQTTMSFTALGKLAEFTGFAPVGSLEGVHWKKLEEEIYGEPLYKRLQKRRSALAVRA